MALDEEPPTLDERRELYSAAVAFRDLRPWERMSDTDLFGVVSPEDGQVGYCSITGEDGEPPGLLVHRGVRGFTGFLTSLHGGPEDLMARILGWDHLAATFEDRGALERRDLDVIRAIGLRFRGPMSWPLFRSHRPGYLPWVVTGKEARLLAVALRQSVDVSSRAEHDPSFLWDGERRFLHRVPGGTPPAWRDELRPDPGPVPPPAGELPDPARARADVAAAERLAGERWEVDVFPARAIGETREGRPYVVHAILWIDQGQRGWMRSETVEPADVPRAVPVMTHSTIRLVGAPDAVLVPREEVRALLGPLLEGTGVGLEVVPRLPGVERAKALLNERLGRPGPGEGTRPG